MTLTAWGVQRRNARIMDEVEGLHQLLPARRLRQLGNGVRQLAMGKAGIAGSLPADFSLGVSDDGLSFWGGTSQRPSFLGLLNWGRIIEVEPASIRLPLSVRYSSGITVTVRNPAGRGEAPIKLPIVLRGGGLGGLWAARDETIDELLATIRASRQAARRSKRQGGPVAEEPSSEEAGPAE